MKDLFDDTSCVPDAAPPRYPNAPGFTEPTTSKAAADAIAPEINERQTEVFEAFRNAGPSGLTADQAAAKTGRTVLAVRPRVSELSELGLIERSGERRTNESGLKAAVWRIKA